MTSASHQASPAREVAEALQAIAPEGVIVRVWEGEDVPELLGDEAASVVRALDARRVEFARGRACARQAIVALGGPPATIPVGLGRAPVWPAGFVGSITHTRGLVAAVAARSESFGSVGVDAEPSRPLPAEVRRLVLAPSEVRPEEPELETVTFSAKESIYKALFPLTGSWLDFLDVEVRLDVTTGRFSAHRLRDGSPGELAVLAGRFAEAGGYVLTLSHLPADEKR